MSASEKWTLPLRAALAAVALPGTGTLLVPWLLLRGGGSDLPIGSARFVALVPLALGVAGLVWCIADFARLGRGTLAPVDPPRFVVRGGLYRFVRNPMYVCVVSILLSEALLFESRALLAWAGIAALTFHLFVVLYEEPSLSRVRRGAARAYDLRSASGLAARALRALASTLEFGFLAPVCCSARERAREDTWRTRFATRWTAASRRSRSTAPRSAMR